MDARFQGSWAARRQHVGLTVLEFLACVVAVLGGVWIGATYLGVDMQQVAHTALVETDMLEKVPAKWRPQGKDQPSQESAADDSLDEFSRLKNDIAALRVVEHENGEASKSTNRDTDAKQKTLAYWLRLNEIVLSELDLQRETESALNKDNASKVFAIKGRTSTLTAKQIAAIPTDEVEPSVVQFGRQLEDWYAHSGELYGEAVEIWDRPTSDRSRETMNKEWRAKELQHRNEARLLHERATRVRNSLSREFGEQFPAFAQPAETAPAATPSTESAQVPKSTEAPTGDEVASEGEQKSDKSDAVGDESQAPVK